MSVLCQKQQIFSKIAMSGPNLRETFSSYMTKLDDSSTIISLLFISQYAKWQIGIHLEGLVKPDNRLNVQFTPGPSVLATKLDWTSPGAILYFQVMKTSPINVGQRIGTLYWQPFEQPGKKQPSSWSVKFMNWYSVPKACE